MNPRPISSAAFTLVEITVALAIIALALMTLTTATITATDTRIATESRDLALQGIESTLEDILTHRFGDIPSFAGFYSIGGLDAPDGRTDVLEVRVQTLGSEDDLLEIVFDAAWENRLGPGSLTLRYVHANIGG